MEAVARICASVTGGATWNEACRDARTTYTSFYRLRKSNPQVDAWYHEADTIAADWHAGMVTAVFDGVEARDALLANYKSQAHKWAAMVRNRRKYGQKVDHTSGGLSLADALKQAAALRSGPGATAPLPAITATATIADRADEASEEQQVDAA